MANPNPNDTKLEQERSESATASLKSQTENNYVEDSEAAADRIANNLKSEKEDKQFVELDRLSITIMNLVTS